MDTLTAPQIEALEYYARRVLIGVNTGEDVADYGATLNLIKMELINADASRLTDAGITALAQNGYPALAEAIDHARNRCVVSPITVKWHVGSNDYGYTPESPVSCHDDPAYARDALAADIARFAEYVGEQCGHEISTQDCANCVRQDAARAIVNTLSGDFDMGEGVRFDLYDGRPLPVVFWAWPVSMDHAENRCNQD